MTNVGAKLIIARTSLVFNGCTNDVALACACLILQTLIPSNYLVSVVLNVRKLSPVRVRTISERFLSAGKNIALCHGAMVWITGKVLCEMLMLRQGQIVRSSLLQLANAFSQNVPSLTDELALASL